MIRPARWLPLSLAVHAAALGGGLWLAREPGERALFVDMTRLESETDSARAGSAPAERAAAPPAPTRRAPVKRTAPPARSVDASTPATTPAPAPAPAVAAAPPAAPTPSVAGPAPAVEAPPSPGAGDPRRRRRRRIRSVPRGAAAPAPGGARVPGRGAAAWAERHRAPGDRARGHGPRERGDAGALVLARPAGRRGAGRRARTAPRAVPARGAPACAAGAAARGVRAALTPASIRATMRAMATRTVEHGPDGSVTEYDEVSVRGDAVERLLTELFSEHWAEVFAGPVIEGAAYEIRFTAKPALSMLDGYLTVDVGAWHFHLCVGEHRGAATPEQAARRRVARAAFFKTDGGSCVPGSWGLRLWNGHGEQMISVFFPNPWLDDAQQRTREPRWDGTALWEDLRRRYAGDRVGD